MSNIGFEKFPKISRFNRNVIVTEKIDGTNAQIYITDDNIFYTGSRNKWVTPSDDNYGFSKWCLENKEEILRLGPGRHYGEWWGKGIQRGYDQTEKRFSLFNTSRWENKKLPNCISLVPVLRKCTLDTLNTIEIMSALEESGSIASPGFMRPEGIVVFHSAANICFKKTFEHDFIPKSLGGK